MQNTNNHSIRAFTGTNGKTSSAYLCHQLLLSRGIDSIYIGTIGVQLNNKEINNSIVPLSCASATFLHIAAGAFSLPPFHVPYGPKIL